MPKLLFTLALMLALSIAGAAWALQPAGGATATERVLAADRSGASSVAPLVSRHRRLLGLGGLAMFGAALVIRARRPLTI
jgi:hypothetical protein